MNKQESPVEFTQRQLDFLERAYPEILARPEVSLDQVRFNAGQRSVILNLRSRLQK